MGLWKEVDVATITGPVYGQDPNLVKPSVPWPLTLTQDQRAVLRIAADLILPPMPIHLQQEVCPSMPLSMNG